MAWTTISNALVAVGALPFATTIQALRDNPIAIANGDVGAPQIQTAAIADSAVTNGKLVSSERLSTANILFWVALGSVGAVGTYAFLLNVDVSMTAGTTYPGSSLRYSSTANNAGATPGGTWRAMGTASGTNTATLMMRVS